MKSIKCPCSASNCRAEIIMEDDAMMIRMNDCAGIRIPDPEFRFILDPNTATELIKALKEWLIR